MDVLGESHYNVSRHLKILLKAGIVSASREGKWVFYTLKTDDSEFYNQLLKTIQLIPSEEFKEEIKRCNLRLNMRKNGDCVIGQENAEWLNIMDLNK
nr:ArsR family transcriptional regulator [Shewanella putrefaciens]